MADKVNFPKVFPKNIQWLNVLKCFQDLIYFEIVYALEKTNNITKSCSTSPLGKNSKKICSAIIYVLAMASPLSL